MKQTIDNSQETNQTTNNTQQNNELGYGWREVIAFIIGVIVAQCNTHFFNMPIEVTFSLVGLPVFARFVVILMIIYYPIHWVLKKIK